MQGTLESPEDVSTPDITLAANPPPDPLLSMVHQTLTNEASTSSDIEQVLSVDTSKNNPNSANQGSPLLHFHACLHLSLTTGRQGSQWRPCPVQYACP